VTDWLTLSMQVALTVVGAVVVDRVQAFRRRPVFVGVFFGLLSAAACFFPVAEIAYYDLPVVLAVVPPIVVGFFYGAVAALVSGGLAGLANLLSAFAGINAHLAVCSAFGTVAATLYAAVLGRWVFGDRRPPLCTAVIAGAYGVVVYLAVGSLFGSHDLPTVLEVVLSSFMPLTAGACLAVGLVVGIGGTWRGWWRGFFSSLNLAFLLVGLAVSVTSTIIVLNAKEEGRAIVRHAVIDLTAEMESQARYMLHESAVVIADALADLGRAPTREDLARHATMVGVDLASVADTNGLVVITTEAGLSPGQPIDRDPEALRQYLSLCDGSVALPPAERGEARFVCGPYQPYGVRTNDWVKHFGYPLPNGGLLRLSFLWSKFQVKFPQYIKPTLVGRHIGETGFYLIFGKRGILDLPVPDRPDTKGLSFSEIGLDAEALARPYETVFHARILGVLSQCVSFEPIGGYRLFAVLPLAETQGPALVMSTLVALVLMTICIVFRLVLVRFRQAQARIDALHAEEERRRKEDLELARSIQRAELRTDGTEGEGYRLSSLMDAAREVGGDFYDYYELPDGRLVVTVADVSGKGVPAAFFMMKSRVTLKSCVYSSATLAEAFAKANVRLAANNPADMFVTAWAGVYDRKTGVLEFVSAGHNPPLLRRSARTACVEWLQAPRSPAMGNFADARYRGARATLGSGDRLFLYTDGVTEAMNAQGELFGNDRLLAVLGRTEGALVPAVRAAVEDFVAGAEQADDITMLELAIP